MERPLILLLALASIAHAADLGISPPRLDLAAAPGETVVATVTLLTNAASGQQIATDRGDWTLDSTGDTAFLPAGTVRYSAADWIELDVDAFVVPPAGTRDVRVAVTVPADGTLEGTYHAMVFFTVVPAPTATPGVGVITTTRIGLTVYVTVIGTERAGSELVDLYQVGERSLVALVANLGNTVMRVGGAIELRAESGEVRHRLEVPDVPILRDGERELAFTLPESLEAGFYVALALIQDSRGGLLAGELPLEVP